MEKEEQKNENVSKKAIFKVNLAILLAVLLIFGGIVLFTGFLGTFFSKTVENVVLVIIAAILAVLLYKSKRS